MIDYTGHIAGALDGAKAGESIGLLPENVLSDSTGARRQVDSHAMVRELHGY